MSEPPDSSARRFEFVATPAVLSARTRGSFVVCPVCQADNERYLFHKLGVRFVRCRSCGLVYANPPATTGRHYFDVEAAGQHKRATDRALFEKELADIVRTATMQFERRHSRPPREVLLVGRVLTDAPMTSGSSRVTVLRLGPDQTERLSLDGDVGAIVAQIGAATDVLVLNEVLEACPHSTLVMNRLTSALGDDALVAIVFSNVGSFPARVLRRHWPAFFAWKSVYFDPDNLTRLMDKVGLSLVGHERRLTPYTLAYIVERLSSKRPVTPLLERAPLASLTLRLPAGTSLAMFEKKGEAHAPEMLSVIVPVFNEETYVARVLDALLAKEVSIPKEVIVVESNSTDRTREIVRSYEGTPGLRVIYEDKPRGKGSAVRRGLAEAHGSIFLIQDADFEYDLDDYDALLEPILQRRTSFVLGSRSLGLDDWKVRRYASSRLKAFLMNFAQVMFAKTFNVLYQQRTTDVNTMFKVFRRECIDGIDFRGNGFNFDIELACMIVVNGFSPMEVPVNYVARGFDEGKKINFITEFYPSYSMLYRCRFGRRVPANMTELFRYEGDEVDIDARDLPGLKARFLVQHVPDGGVVVDVGCGGGKMLRTLARERPGAQLHGCDLKAPAARNPSFEFRLIDDSGRLPYDDASVDTALVIDVLEHVPHPDEFLSEVARVLRPGGRLIGFLPTEGQRFSFYRLFRALLGDDLYVTTKDHIQAFRRVDVSTLLDPAFDIEQQRYAYHFLGHLMDASFCAMLRVPFVKRMFWNESPYHNRDRRPSVVGSIFAGSLIAANRLAWAESTALAKIPYTSAGTLLSARRR